MKPKPMFPTAEIMDEATEPLEVYDPIRNLREFISCTDDEEMRLWRGRSLDGRRVYGTIAGIMDSPCVVVEAEGGRGN